ncbi:MAG: hypothetical protein VZS44_12315, partial [Bacilli bacterium]|nr:hypothetical protein [Bacilli bacterium]
MKAISGEPLSVEHIFELTGRDACTRMDNYKVRIMNYSPNQQIEVIDIVSWKGYKWGIKEISKSKPEYDYFAFLIEKED